MTKFKKGQKFRFRDFKIYKELREFLIEVKTLTKKSFPKNEEFGLRSQLWRALDSVILNIAEGSDKATDKEFARYLNISNASLNEVVACLDISRDNEYITEKELLHYIKQAELLSNQITAFRRKLLLNPTK